MKVKEFLQWVDLNRHLLDDCQEKEVKVHLLAEGHILYHTLDIERFVYKFNPFSEKPKGALCVEVKMKENT